MRHFIYEINGDAPAPQGVGDSRTWFYFYKFHPGLEYEEVYVPMPYGNYPERGDMLWFCLDRWFVGAVPILRVDDDHINGRLEIWYKSSEVTTLMIRHIQDIPLIWDQISSRFGDPLLATK